ncbi:hypothetical protein [Profundibacter sp.]
MQHHPAQYCGETDAQSILRPVRQSICMVISQEDQEEQPEFWHPDVAFFAGLQKYPPHNPRYAYQSEY